MTPLTKPKAKQRRPSWITRDKVMVGLHWLANKAGVVIATEAEIGRAAHVGASGIEPALMGLEDQGKLRMIYQGRTLWKIVLTKDPAGAGLAEQLVPPMPASILKQVAAANKPAKPRPPQPEPPAATGDTIPVNHDGSGSPAKSTQLVFDW